MGSILYVVVMIGVFYFLLIRPQQKKAKALTNLRNEIVSGDKVVTIGGMIGTVVSVVEDEIRLDVEGTTLAFKKWAISTKAEGSDKEEVEA